MWEDVDRDRGGVALVIRARFVGDPSCSLVLSGLSIRERFFTGPATRAGVPAVTVNSGTSLSRTDPRCEISVSRSSSNSRL